MAFANRPKTPRGNLTPTPPLRPSAPPAKPHASGGGRIANLGAHAGRIENLGHHAKPKKC